MVRVTHRGGRQEIGTECWLGLPSGEIIRVLLTAQFCQVFLVYAMAVQLDSSDGVTDHFFIRGVGGPQSGS